MQLTSDPPVSDMSPTQTPRSAPHHPAALQISLNSKIRLINHRGYGHHSAAAVIAMIYPCCSGLTITLPTGR